MSMVRSIALCGAIALGNVCYADVVGYVKTASGQATIRGKAQAVPAKPGDPLSVGDLIETGPDGSLGVTLKDNTVMSFGPSTRFALDEYLFAPAKGELKLGATFSRGTLHYVSGGIAKLKPEAVSIKTPTGIIGVRGTRFVAVVE